MYDVWLIDSETEEMYCVETGLDRETAVAWWLSWDESRNGCICVIVPEEIGVPDAISVIRIPEHL